MSQLLGLKQEQDKQKFLPSWEEREKKYMPDGGKVGENNIVEYYSFKWSNHGRPH